MADPHVPADEARLVAEHLTEALKRLALASHLLDDLDVPGDGEGEIVAAVNKTIGLLGIASFNADTVAEYFEAEGERHGA